MSGKLVSPENFGARIVETIPTCLLYADRPRARSFPRQVTRRNYCLFWSLILCIQEDQHIPACTSSLGPGILHDAGAWTIYNRQSGKPGIGITTELQLRLFSGDFQLQTPTKHCDRNLPWRGTVRHAIKSAMCQV